MCRVSVLMIVYNSEREVGRALSSALCQTLAGEDMEVVVVDDGSTDGTADVVAHFARLNNRLHLVRLPRNMGRSYARNTALEEARGDYVLFLDADDFLTHDALQRLLHATESGRHDLVIGGRRNFDVKTMQWREQEHLSTIMKSPLRGCNLRQYPAAGRDQFITGKLYSRQLLQDNGIRFATERRNAEDILFAFETWMAARSFSYFPDIVYCYAQGNFLGKATVGKVEDACSNYMKCIDRINGIEDNGFQWEMHINICFNLDGLFLRAAHVLDRQKLAAFMERFRSFFEDLPPVCLDRSPARIRQAAQLVVDGREEQAADLFTQE